jgi:hypothetical protein
MRTGAQILQFRPPRSATKCRTTRTPAGCPPWGPVAPPRPSLSPPPCETAGHPNTWTPDTATIVRVPHLPRTACSVVRTFAASRPDLLRPESAAYRSADSDRECRSRKSAGDPTPRANRYRDSEWQPHWPRVCQRAGPTARGLFPSRSRRRSKRATPRYRFCRCSPCCGFRRALTRVRHYRSRPRRCCPGANYSPVGIDLRGLQGVPELDTEDRRQPPCRWRCRRHRYDVRFSSLVVQSMTCSWRRRGP